MRTRTRRRRRTIRFGGGESWMKCEGKSLFVHACVHKKKNHVDAHANIFWLSLLPLRNQNCKSGGCIRYDVTPTVRTSLMLRSTFPLALVFMKRGDISNGLAFLR